MRKFLILICSVICIFTTTFAITGCSEGVHTHTYSSTWSYNETNHYHKATCEHSILTSEVSPHTYELNSSTNKEVCTVCGKVKGDNSNDDVNLLEKLVNAVSELNFKGTGSYTYKTKDTNGEVTKTQDITAEFSSSITNNHLYVDAINNSTDSSVVFIRDSKMYKGDVFKSNPITSLNQFGDLTSQLTYTLYDRVQPLFDYFELDSDVLTPMLDILKDGKTQEIVDKLLDGVLSYVDLNKVTNDDDTTDVTIDLRDDLLEFYTLYKDLGVYLDANHKTASVQDLFYSGAFKNLVNPLISKLNGKDCEVIVKHIKNLYEANKKRQFPVAIVPGSNENAYEYFALYLNVDIKFGLFQTPVKIGEIMLDEVLDEYYTYYEDEYLFTDDAQDSIEKVSDSLPKALISYTYKEVEGYKRISNITADIIEVTEKTSQNTKVNVDITYDASYNLQKADISVDVMENLSLIESFEGTLNVIEENLTNTYSLTYTTQELVGNSYKTDGGNVEVIKTVDSDDDLLDLSIYACIGEGENPSYYLDLDVNATYVNANGKKKISSVSLTKQDKEEVIVSLTMNLTYTNGQMTKLVFDLDNIDKGYTFDVTANVSYASTTAEVPNAMQMSASLIGKDKELVGDFNMSISQTIPTFTDIKDYFYLNS